MGEGRSRVVGQSRVKVGVVPSGVDSQRRVEEEGVGGVWVNCWGVEEEQGPGAGKVVGAWAGLTWLRVAGEGRVHSYPWMGRFALEKSHK